MNTILVLAATLIAAFNVPAYADDGSAASSVILITLGIVGAICFLVFRRNATPMATHARAEAIREMLQPKKAGIPPAVIHRNPRGREELDDQPVLSDRDQFDEVAYLRLYPDIAKAIAEGSEPGAWQHYDRHGRREGRKANDFDAEFYLRAYPAAQQEIAAGLAETAFEHYRRFGRFRGFVANVKAPRPADAAAMTSRFGGLWPDLPNASDLIEGKLEIGQITERQAEKLTFWMNNGYVILENAIPSPLVDKGALDLERAYAGGFPDLNFECHAVAPDHIHWQPEINAHPAKALDIHHFSPAVRDLMFADAIAEFLGVIFESKAFASQTLGFLRGSAQEGHQDSAYVPYTIPRQFAATWIALEDVTIGAGELFYYPGSHRFEDFVYKDQFKSVHEAQRVTGERPLASRSNTTFARWRNAPHSVALPRCSSPRRRATYWYGTPIWCTAATPSRASPRARAS